MAYFYCARNAAEPERANPEEIMRSILEQLSGSDIDLPIKRPVVTAYKEKKRESRGRIPEKLDIFETVDLIITLLDENPVIIILDALDECDSSERHKLLNALDTIIQESSSLVKVFVSSRDDGDLVCKLALSPNVFIRASDNGADIERFVHTEVARAIENKRMVKGNVSPELQDQIVATLVQGAHGM